VIEEMSGNLKSLKNSYALLRHKSNKLEDQIMEMKGEISYIKVYE